MERLVWLTATALASAHDAVIHAGTLIDGVSSDARWWRTDECTAHG